MKLKIHVESDQLIMYGTPAESAGCVLRGVLELNVTEPTKVKSISLRFSGKMTITWTERKHLSYCFWLSFLLSVILKFMSFYLFTLPFSHSFCAYREYYSHWKWT